MLSHQKKYKCCNSFNAAVHSYNVMKNMPATKHIRSTSR